MRGQAARQTRLLAWWQREGEDPCRRPGLWCRERDGEALALSVFPLVIYVAAFAVAGVSTGASLAVYASAPVLYFITITLLRRLAPRGSAERQFT